MLDIEQQLLEELVYQRTRSSVNLCQLLLLEQDLEHSVERVLDGRSNLGDGDCSEIARRYVDDAWRRLEAEWADMRERHRNAWVASPDPRAEVGE